MDTILKIGEIFKLSSGKSLPEKKRVNGVYNVYGGNGITGNHNNYFVSEPTIVIGRVGEYCGAVHLTTKNSWVTDNALMVTTWYVDVNKRFMLYALNAMNLHQYAKTVGQPSISQGSIYNLTLDVPNIEKQSEIVSTLDKLQSTITHCQKQLEKLDELIKARFVEMFGDMVINDKCYPVKALPEIAEYWNGLTYKPEDVSEKGTIVLRSSNIQNACLDFTDTVRVSCKIGDKKYVKNNDILMCSRNGSARLVGKVALIDNISEPMSFGAFMMIIRSKYYHYLMTYFQMPAFRMQIATGATTTINQITGNMLNKVQLPVPDMQTIEKFADLVKQTDKSKLAVKQVLEKAETLKKALMQEYFG